MALKALAWLAVPLLGLTELGAHFYFSRRPPDLAEWRGVRDAVAAERQSGDLIVIAPDWVEPNARHAFGDALMPLSDVARADESAFRRAVEVGILGAESTELSGWKVLSEKRAGKFRLRTLANPAPAVVVYDFVDHVADAAVAEVRAGVDAPCPWDAAARRSAGGLHGDPAFPAERHQCAHGDGRFVGVTVIEDSAWRGRRCLWAPPETGATLSIRYPNVPLGRIIHGYGATPWWNERELRLPPVELHVLVNGEPVGVHVHRAGESWKRFEIPAGTGAGGRGDVEFRVDIGRGREREFCFQADTR